MLPLGIPYSSPHNTCLGVIKNLLPEIRTPDILGDSRLWNVLRLQQVSNVQDGDLIVWAKEKVFDFQFQHIVLVVNSIEHLVYGVHYTDSSTMITNYVHWIFRTSSGRIKYFAGQI